MAIITRQLDYDRFADKADEIERMVRPPGFEPGSQAWEACIIATRQRSQHKSSKPALIKDYREKNSGNALRIRLFRIYGHSNLERFNHGA